jgi:triacylglycerol lipase
MTVNIFRQRPTGSDEKLPVAVYIHGDAFNRGSCKMFPLAQVTMGALEADQTQL